VFEKMLNKPGGIIAINCKAGFHRTSAFCALLAAVLVATCFDRNLKPFQFFDFFVIVRFQVKGSFLLII